MNKRQELVNMIEEYTNNNPNLHYSFTYARAFIQLVGIGIIELANYPELRDYLVDALAYKLDAKMSRVEALSDIALVKSLDIDVVSELLLEAYLEDIEE